MKDFGHIDDVIKRYDALFPGQLAYINLYPVYGNAAPSGIDPELQKVPSQLGTTTYQEHIDSSWNRRHRLHLLRQLSIHRPVRQLSGEPGHRRSSLPEQRPGMWVIIQTGAWKADAILGEYQVR